MTFNKKASVPIRISLLFFSFIGFCLLLAMQPPYVHAEFENPGILSAQSFLKPELIKGEYYTVNENVHNDGILNHYDVNSSFGHFRVISTSSLIILIREIEAIAEMKKIENEP